MSARCRPCTACSPPHDRVPARLQPPPPPPSPPQAGALIHTALGCNASVLGLKDGELWAQYAGSGIEAPLGAGWAIAPPATQLAMAVAASQQEQRALDAKWKAYNEAAEAAAKATAKKKKPAAAAGEQGKQGGGATPGRVGSEALAAA